MNKAWITALSIAGIAGSASAAYAGLSVNGNEGAPAEAQGLPAAPATTLAPIAAPASSPATATYQVGDAGTVTVTNVSGVVSVQSAMPSPGWTVQGYTSPAGHVEVQFVNALQAVTFHADVVNGEMVASLAEAPTVPSTDVTTTEVPATEAPTTVPTPTPLPAVPAAPAVTAPETPKAPSHAATTAPSSHGGSSASNGGSSHGDDGDDEGDYENEENDD